MEEVRSPVGTLLWHSVHDVVLWGSTPPERRADLFARAAAVNRVRDLRAAEMDDQLRVWLGGLARVLDGDQPPRLEEVVATCRRVSDWAEREGLPRTAIWYAQAAALLAPTVAEHAWRVGDLCRNASEYARAVTWFARSIVLARRRRDGQTYARAYRRIGQLLMHKGAYGDAEKAFGRAFRYARRAGIREVAAEALHDLFTVAVETGRVAEAQELARRAFHAYPAAHGRLPALAHDIAVFWMFQGYPARALPVLQAVRSAVHNLSDQLLAVSSIARAAGEAGDLEAFVAAWVDTWAIIDANPHLDCITSSLILLAQGSEALGDRERVEVAARYALEVATARGQSRVAEDARILLAGADVTRTGGTGNPDPAADRLATRLTRRIRSRPRQAAGTSPDTGPCLGR
ncbi:MAG TPA: tetratricopeptide repeat protein [Longimicrobiaceae bacterium]|nr:tetratricopeptide repeat protein [Longimicrobiaceae bacterium]